MQTFKIPENNLDELYFVYYRLKAMDELLNDNQRNKSGFSPKWLEYLTNMHNELQKEYNVVAEKIAFQFDPFNSFSYCIDIAKGSINYCES